MIGSTRPVPRDYPAGRRRFPASAIPGTPGERLPNQLGNWGIAGLYPGSESFPIRLPNVSFALNGEGIVDHMCAVTSTGRMWCWGANGAGELGGGADTPKPYLNPLQVWGITEWAAVSAGVGSQATCATSTAGSLYCWGGGLSSILGPGPVPTPLLIPVAGFVVSAARLRRFLVADGTVQSWESPTALESVETGVDRVTDLHSGSGLVAVRGDGSVWLWKYQLQLAPSGTWKIDSPMRLGGFTNVVGVESAGTQVIAGLRTDGQIQTWGTGGMTGGYYRLGVPDPYASTWKNKKGPGALDEIFTAELIDHAIDVSVESTISPASCCALIADGTVKCWGSLQSDKGNGFKLPPIYIPKVMPYLP